MAAPAPPLGTPVLHADPRSSASLRVLLVLDHKRIAFALSPVRLLAGEHRLEAFAQVNPAHAVPALDVGDGSPPLTQSLAICEWLEAMHPTPPLLQADPTLAARVRALCQLVACDVHPLTNLRVRQAIGRLAGEAAAQDWVRGWTVEGLAAVEATLARTAGPWCFGAAPTLADAFVAPLALNARRAGLDLEAIAPRTAAVYRACRGLPGFARLREIDPDGAPLSPA